MIVYRSFEEVTKDKNTVLTVGTFDGVHLGHRQILETVLAKANSRGGRSLVVTFDPHPRQVLYPESELKLLLTIEEKIHFIGKSGISHLLLVPFNKVFSQLNSEEFISEYLAGKVGFSEIVVGHDHHFGKDRIGNESTLKRLGEKYGFNCACLNAFEAGGSIVSSSKIRQLLSDGEVGRAGEMLGYNYLFSGLVVEGNKRGRTIGFPTANIQTENINKILPGNGVYAVRLEHRDSIYNGVMNLGFRPTFENSGSRFCEVHLFGFSGSLYAESVTVHCIEKLRDEKKFENVEALVQQIRQDAETAKRLLT